MKPNVAIIGLGLIGGSLGLALKRNPDLHVTGYDRSFSTLERSLSAGESSIQLPRLLKMHVNMRMSSSLQRRSIRRLQ